MEVFENADFEEKLAKINITIIYSIYFLSFYELKSHDFIQIKKTLD